MDLRIICRLAALCLALLSPQIVRAEQGSVRGIVFAPETDEPMSGVVVKVLDKQTVTDQDGAFEIALPPGEYQIFCHGETIGPIPVVGGEVTELVISLQREGRRAAVAVEAARAIETKRPEEVAAKQVGKVVGICKHVEKGTPVSGARIFVRGSTVEGRTDDSGTFEISLPTGSHHLTVVHPEFSTLSLPDTDVAAGRVKSLRVELTPAAVQLSDFTVTAPRVEGAVVALMDERRESGAVSDVIGAEQMSKSGDSYAASALKRVTGVTVVGGKYVYVRGLGERYSSTLLNGSSLPSPEPERRVVPLDMFPADLLDSLVIQKTFSPDMPGEFGGGSVQIRTRGFPDEFTAKVSASVGARVDTTFENGLHYHGGDLDFLGIDDGIRQLPDEVAEASKNSPLLERDMFSDRGYLPEELERFGELMHNIWSPTRYTTPPNVGINATIGDGFSILGCKSGFLAALVYDNSYSQKIRWKNIYNLGAGGGLELFHRYRFEELENTVTLAGILATGIDFSERHKLRLTTLVDRITDDEARIYQGENRDVDGQIRVARLRWIERMLFAQQVQGLHTLTGFYDLGLDWRYNFSLASRTEPDRREVRYDQETETRWLLSDRPEGNQRVFSDLLDQNHDLGLDATLPFNQWDGLEAKVKAGVGAALKSREVDTRRYKFQHKGGVSGDTDIISLPPEEIFTEENIAPGNFQFEEITRQTDNYAADQQVIGGYAMTDLPLGGGFRFVGGLRVEYSRQHVKTFELFNPDFEPVTSELSDIDLLPAGTFSWEFSEDMLLRAGVSRTLSRPDFRELSPATFNDVTGGRQIFGNPELKRAAITNVDLRWEWYLAAGESVSISAFYKRFEQPIETIVVVSAQHSVTYENADGADNLGVEVEFRKSLDVIHKWLSDFYLAGNATYVYSQIRLPAEGIQTSSKRPLQGQSPYVLNFQAGYDNPDWGTSVVLLYNVFGRRIAEVGALGAPDVYEQPFHQFDLVVKQSLGSGFFAGFSAKNLLDSEVRYTQGSETTETFHRGRAFSLSISKSF